MKRTILKAIILIGCIALMLIAIRLKCVSAETLQKGDRICLSVDGVLVSVNGVERYECAPEGFVLTAKTIEDPHSGIVVEYMTGWWGWDVKVEFTLMKYTGYMWEVTAFAKIGETRLWVKTFGDTLPEAMQKVWEKLSEAKDGLENCQ